MSKHDDEVESLKSLYEYWKQNGEYDGIAQEFVEFTAQDINQQELWEKLAGAGDLDASDAHEVEDTP